MSSRCSPSSGGECREEGGNLARHCASGPCSGLPQYFHRETILVEIRDVKMSILTLWKTMFFEIRGIKMSIFHQESRAFEIPDVKMYIFLLENCVFEIPDLKMASSLAGKPYFLRSVASRCHYSCMKAMVFEIHGVHGVQEVC